jgi:AFG3 family protein
MADKKENNKPLLPTRPPKGNYQVWVILATIAVILGVMYINNSNELKEIQDMSRLKRMIESRDVKKITLIKSGDGWAEVTLTPNALQNAKYRQDI